MKRNVTDQGGRSGGLGNTVARPTRDGGAIAARCARGRATTRRRVFAALVVCVVLLIFTIDYGTAVAGMIDIGGVKFEYEEQGSGQAIILIGGGAMMDARQWERQADYLGDAFISGRRVIEFNPRGVGRSQAPQAPYSDAADLAAFMDALDVDKAVLIGLSSAGALVLDFAITRPDRVCSIVAVGPALPGWEPDRKQRKRMERFSQAYDKGVDDFVREVLEDDNFVPAPHATRDVHDRVQELIRANFASQSKRPLATPLSPPTLEQVGKIEVPTLLVVGKLDHDDVHKRVEYLHKEIKGSRVASAQQAGHVVNLESPDEFNLALSTFLRSNRCR